ncbi:MAG TPA: DNA-processing protein DprA [Gemmatimonadales bacterium]|nr:DNA-processing protein DprA [Gemmatimonadales bacterium]
MQEPDIPIEGEERIAYLTLALTPGVNASRLRNLIQKCITPSGALTAPLAFLETVPEMKATVAQSVHDAKMELGHRVMDDLARVGGQLLLPGDPVFPRVLFTVEPAPTYLFAMGRIELLARPAVAIVGSRDHTRYGAEVCEAIAGGAAAAGVVVVSGMARGLDAVAHHAALAAGGGSIGVLGCGLGVIYPESNRMLYSLMRTDGLLLTEAPPGERPKKGSFPKRNRIIAGLARATVVVEAAVGSGALITANEALDQGKDVLAVPGGVTSPTSVGTNRLLRDGAAPLLDLEDLLSRYPEVNLLADATDPDASTPSGAVIAMLKAGPRQADEIAATLRFPTGQVLALLGIMEIQGLVVQRPGLTYSLPRARFAAG